MKIIYSGGYQKENDNSNKNSWWYRHENNIRVLDRAGKKVAVVTLAKADDHYQKYLDMLPGSVEIINNSVPEVDWGEYDAIYIAGGDTDILKNKLNSRGFSMDKLKNQVILLGDSAGAYVLSSFFYTDIDGAPGTDVEFHEAFNAEAKNICIAHSDNPYYVNDALIKKVRSFAKENDLSVVLLKENVEKVVEQNT
ncbi:MAG TPA: Type 1 glutamine amidotransferase-like domain-containing protein [Candidatus Babeliales bacterium]|nr:Type 1 glutamine amidotransferase-like domain-containing protein [Candidatus Babeliales bacterium]